MRYLLAVLLPPVAVAFCAGTITTLLNLLLTLCLYFPGMIHAVMVVHDYKSEKRNDKLIKAIKSQTKG